MYFRRKIKYEIFLHQILWIICYCTVTLGILYVRLGNLKEFFKQKFDPYLYILYVLLKTKLYECL